MDGFNIITVSVIIIAIVVIISVIIFLVTSNRRRYVQSSGVGAKGDWVMVATSVGPLPSYIFTNKKLINEKGEYLLIQNGKLTIGPSVNNTFSIEPPFFKSISSSDAVSYINLNENNNLVLSETASTSWLFDGYNIYLASSLSGSTKAIFSQNKESNEVVIVTVQNPELYNLPGTELGKWIPT